MRVVLHVKRVLSLGPAVMGLVVGGGGAFLCFSRVWLRATVDGSGLPDSSVAVTGSQLHGGAAALSLVAGVAGLGVLAASGRLRCWIGVLAAGSAGAAVLMVAFGSAAVAAAKANAATTVTGRLETWHHTWFEPLTVVALLVALLAGTVVSLRGSRWPTMGRKFDAPTAQVRVDDDMWAALDRGDDPTR